MKVRFTKSIVVNDDGNVFVPKVGDICEISETTYKDLAKFVTVISRDTKKDEPEIEMKSDYDFSSGLKSKKTKKYKTKD